MELLKPSGKKITINASWPSNFGSATLEIDSVITGCEFKGDDIDYDFMVVGFGMGFMCHTAIIEAGHLQDALDEWADSDMAHLTLIEDEDYDSDFTSFAGNASEPHNFDDIRFVAELSYEQVKAALL